MRENALGLLDLVKKQGLAYIFYRSKPKAVMLNIDEFTSIQAILEDCLDEKDARKLTGEPRGEGIPLEKIEQKYV